MKKKATVLILAVLLSGLAGCTSQRIWTTAYANNPKDLSEEMDYFPDGEYPLFVVRAKNKKVGLDVIDRGRGTRVAGRVEERMKDELEPIEMAGQLGPGTFVVQLRIDGEVVDSWPFEIAAPVEQDPAARPLDSRTTTPPTDPELEEVRNAWPYLSSETRESVLAIIRAR